GDVEEAFGVDEAEVARAEPAARHQDLRRRHRVVVVALHDAGALDADLAFLAHRTLVVRRLVLRRQDADGDAAARRPDREEAPLRVEPERRSTRYAGARAR